MSKCSWVGENGREEQRWFCRLPLLSYESAVSLKENPERKKILLHSIQLNQTNFYTLDEPVLCHCSFSIPPEEVRKQDVF